MKFKLNKIIFVIAAFIFSIIFIYPIYFTLVSAFKNNTEIWNTMFALPSKVKWSNFVSAVTEVKILTAIANSFVFSIGASVVIVVFVSMASYVIARKIIPFANGLRLYYLLGLMIPPYAMLIPIVKMFTQFGLRDQYLPMIMLYAVINFPMSFYLIIGYIKGINSELDEAATVDGCNTFQTVFRVIIPVARPGIFTAAIISFLAVYNELIFANTLLTNKSMKTIAVRLMGLQGERFTSYGPMFASIVLSIIPILIIYLLFQEKIEGGVAAGAVKG